MSPGDGDATVVEGEGAEPEPGPEREVEQLDRAVVGDASDGALVSALAVFLRVVREDIVGRGHREPEPVAVVVVVAAPRLTDRRIVERHRFQ